VTDRELIQFLFDPAILPGWTANMAVYLRALMRRGLGGEA
jgi:hypothetical protein